MILISRIKNKIANLSMTRYQRIDDYIKSLKEKSSVKNKQEKRLVDDISLLIDEKIKKVKTLGIIEVALYALLYFSFFSFIFKDFIVLSEFAKIIGVVVGLIGTTVIILVLFLINRTKEL